MERVHLVSLGCPKNRVDSEVMVGQLQRGPYELVDGPDDADVIIVNTCSFIRPAQEESIERIFYYVNRRRPGQRVIAAGCLAERYGAGPPHRSTHQWLT